MQFNSNGVCILKEKLQIEPSSNGVEMPWNFNQILSEVLAHKNASLIFYIYLLQFAWNKS